MLNSLFSKKNVKTAFSYLYLFSSFAILDAWLRVVTRWIGAYSIYAIAPNLFTIFWSLLLTVCITAIPSRRIGRIVYGVVYFLFAAYALVQYGAYMILGDVLFVSDFMYAGEGTDYMSYILSFITPELVVQVLLLAAIGIIGILIYPQKAERRFSLNHGLYRFLISALCVVSIVLIPKLYGEYYEKGDFTHPAYEYQRFVNPGFSLELTGMYQYVARDTCLQLDRRFKDHSSDIALIDSFFEEKTDHVPNEMTGIFAGKNLIVCMMEGIDDWLINETDTPALYYMMNHGINFGGMYTPKYSSGYTFNTEFAFNTSVYPYSNGNAAYALSKNGFMDSLASVFREEGYSANSYHAGYASFYNRGQMHKAFGYSQYHSYHDYQEEDIPINDDAFLVHSDELFNDLTTGAPFYSFVITVSGHLPYTMDDELARYAMSKYPEYESIEHEELATLRAKTKITDNMFAELLARLDQEELLESTVIVGYTDHYAHGMQDKALLQLMTEEAGYKLMEHTPTFIYCADREISIQLDKVVQITDLSPTIMNLFGVSVPKEIMGRDIFDDSYPGYAIFPDNTWMTNEAYMKKGVLQWNKGMSSEEIEQMNEYVQRAYVINDKILDTDYYVNRE